MTTTPLKARATRLLETRRQLPIWAHQDEIRRKVRENDVVLLVGETGSGKSTQVPQFLIGEGWCRKRIVYSADSTATTATTGSGTGASKTPKKVSVGGTIAILQPRRVAATSLASRVAQEMATPLGSASPASLVGYSVRFDSNVSPSTRVKFLTDGMLLQELARDPWLTEYSCVVVDEVHERGVNVDLVLGFLRRLIEGRTREDGRAGVELKVVIMSATADMEGIESFFGPDREGETDNPGCSDEFSGFSDDEVVVRNGKSSSEKESSKRISLTTCHIRGRQYPVTVHYSPTPVTNLLDACLDRITHIHQHSPLPGDILVFLSGQEMIENLESLCVTYASTLDHHTRRAQDDKKPKKTDQSQRLPKLEILPLYAALPTAAQQRIFSTPKDNFTRRVILATNIAETSITVPRIRHVIDTGKQKSRYFRAGLNLDTLLSGPVSRSAAKQRAGRAGREAPGHCYRLYTEADFTALDPDTKPEILQTDLSSLVLTLKSHGVDDVLRFPLLTPPPRKSLEAALLHLLSLDALNEDSGGITDMGRKMALLPLKPELARILLASTTRELDCVDEVVDIVAGLALEEGIFLPIHTRRGRQQENQEDPFNDHTLHTRLHTNGSRKKNTRDLLVTARPDPNLEPKSDSDSDSDPSNPIEQNRRGLLHRHSDHLTLLAAIRAYSNPSISDRRAWCDEHGISHRAMQRIAEARKQLAQLIRSPRLKTGGTAATVNGNHNHTKSSVDGTKSTIDTALPISSHDPQPQNPDQHPPSTSKPTPLPLETRILKSLLTGLHPKIAILTSLHPSSSSFVSTTRNPNDKPPYLTLLTAQPLYIHPSSVLFTAPTSARRREKYDKPNGNERERGDSTRGLPSAIVFTELVYTSKPYARGVSAVEVGWVL